MPTTDNRIVQMTFKNEQFERGVKESLHSLEELKKALDLDKSAESLSNLEKIASSFDISGIAKGIDDIASRFTLVGNIGQEAFRRISSFALDEIHKVTSALTSMPQAGLSKYEQKNKSIQMIQSAMPDKSIEEIETVLAKLNEYTDLTSYDFSTMANSIGKFVSAGVDLEVAERVMEGIANETASAGGEISQANIAMYNFSQALAAGSVKLTDWRSIQNQNLDTKEFKEQIIETAYELGILEKVTDKVGKTAKGTLVDFQSFPKTLQEGWFTSEVMLGVFEKYADRESEVGKKGFEAAKIAITLTQAFDAVKDAISTGWMTSFGYIFGNLEEAGDLFTRISDALIDFTSQISKTRNALLQGWHDGGEDGISGYQKVIEGLSNSWAILMAVFEGAKQAFESVFGVLDSSGLIDASKAFADFTAAIKEYFGYSTEVKKTTEWVSEVWDGVEDWTKPLKKGMKGSEQEIINLQQHLRALKDENIQLGKHGVDGIFGAETEAALKAFQKKMGLKETGVYDEITRNALAKALYPNGKIRKVAQETEETVTHTGKGVQKVKGALEGVAAVAKVVLGVLKFGLQLFGRLVKIVTPVIKGVVELASGLGRLISFFVDFTSSLSLGESALAIFDAALAPIAKALKFVGMFLIFVGNGISDIVVAAKNGVTSFEELGEKLRLNPKTNANGIKLYEILVKIRDIAKKVAPVFETVKTNLVNMFNAVKSWVSGKIADSLSALGTFFTNLWNAIEEGDYLTKILSGIVTALQIVLGIIGGVGYGIYTLAKAFIDGAVALFNFVKNSEFLQNIFSRIASFLRPVKDFFASVLDAINSISGKIGSFKSFGEIWEAFLESLRNNPVGKKFVSVFEKAGKIVTDVRNKIKGFVDAVKKAFSLLTTYKDPEKALQVLMMTRDKNSGAVKIIEFLVKLKNAFIKIAGVAGIVKSKISSLISGVLPGLKSFGKAVVDALKNFFGGDGVSPGEKVTSGFETIKGKLKSAIEGLSQWIGNFVQNSPFLSKLVDFGTKIKDAVTGFFSADTSGIEGLPEKLMARLKAFDPVIQWIKDKFNTVKEFLMDPKKLLSHVVGALKGIGEFVIGIFKNVNLGTIWNVAKSALGTYILLTFAKSLKNFSKSMGVLTGAIDEDEKTGIADKLRSIAVTIAIVTAALAGLALIDAGQALAGVGVMAAAIGVVVGALVALNKWAPKIEGIGKGILSMALSIVAVIAAVAAAALLINTGGDLTKPLLLVGGIIVALGVVAVLISKFSKKYTGATQGTAKTILAMCAGVFLIVKAVEKMAGLLKKYEKDSDKIDSAFNYVASMLVILGTVAVLMSALGKKTGSEGASSGIAPAILAMCTGLGSIVSAVAQMADVMKRYPDHFGGAFAMIEGILVTIGTIAVLLAAFSKDLDWKVSLASAVPIVAMGFFLDTIIKTMGEAIQKISGVNPSVIEQFLIGVAESLVGLVGVVAIFSKIGVGPLLEAAVGIVAIMAAIGAGIDIVATFAADAVDKLATAMWLVGRRLSGFSDNIQNVDVNKIETVLKLMTDSILPAFVTMVQNASNVESALPVVTNIKTLGTGLGLFQRSIRNITVDTGAAIKQLPEDIKSTVEGINAVQGIKEATDVLYSLGSALKVYYGDLAAAMDESGNLGTGDSNSGNFDIDKANAAFNDLASLTLTDETITKLQRFSDDGDQNLNTVAGGIANLGTALKGYGDDISTIDPEKVKTANNILDKIQNLDSHLNPVASTNFDVLKDKKQSISDFGDDVAELGNALGSYGDNIANLNPWKIGMANIVVDAVASLANKLQPTGGLWQILITGEKSLGKFAVNMGDLGSGLAEYARNVSSANFTNVSDSVTVVEGLARAQSILQRYNGLKSLVEGTAGLDKLGANLKGLGTSLVSFATDAKGIKNLKDADFDLLNKAIDPITKLARAQSIIQRAGGLKEKVEGSADIATLGAGLVEFGNSLNTFKGVINDFDFDETKFVTAMDLLQKVVSLQEIVQNGDPNYDFKNAGLNVSLLFATIATAITTDTQITEAVSSAAESIKTVITSNAIDQATTWGLDLVTNLANGMTNNAKIIRDAAEAIAGVIRAYLHFSKPDTGPLADADTYGGDFVNLFANGITGNSDIITQAVNNLAGTAKDSVVKKIQDLFGVEDGIDEPVITPVLDLTNVENGASQIEGMLNGQSVTTSANLAKNIASGNGVTIVQGGAAEDHSQEIITAITELGDRIVTLENQMASHMSNLKVVMNTNALVGQIAPAMNKALGGYANRN